MTKKRTDLCQQLTDQVIESMENGTAPWRMPFDQSQTFTIPANPSTGNEYHGMNIVQLWSEQTRRKFSAAHWLTYKQTQAIGGQVRKGEYGTPAIFYKVLKKDTGETDDQGNRVIDGLPILKRFTVFNLDQIDGIEPPDPRPRFGFNPVETAEAVLAASGAQIGHGGAGAYYRPAVDAITLPDRDRFDNAADYYATALHELTHATKHVSRCDRKSYETTISGGAYAFEELVAELGALFTMAALGLRGSVQGHDNYIEGWLSVLKNDKRAIFKAAGQAQAAHDWIMTRYEDTLALVA